MKNTVKRSIMREGCAFLQVAWEHTVLLNRQYLYSLTQTCLLEKNTAHSNLITKMTNINIC